MNTYFENRLKKIQKCPVCNSTRYHARYCKKCGYYNKKNEEIKL